MGLHIKNSYLSQTFRNYSSYCVDYLLNDECHWMSLQLSEKNYRCIVERIEGYKGSKNIKTSH